MCVKYRAHVSDAMGANPPLTAEEMNALGDSDVMGAYEKASSQIKLLEARKKSIGEFLRGKMARLNTKQIITDEYKSTLQQNACSDFDVATVVSLCQLNGTDTASVVSASKKSVMAVFGSNPQAMQMLNMTMRRGATAPFVVVRALGRKQSAKAVEEADKVP